LLRTREKSHWANGDRAARGFGLHRHRAPRWDWATARRCWRRRGHRRERRREILAPCRRTGANRRGVRTTGTAAARRRATAIREGEPGSCRYPTRTPGPRTARAFGRRWRGPRRARFLSTVGGWSRFLAVPWDLLIRPLKGLGCIGAASTALAAL